MKFPDNDKPSLSHFGVKGMRWGHRKQEETVTPGHSSAREAADHNTLSKDWAKAARDGPDPTPAKAKKDLLDNHVKSRAKLEKDGSDSPPQEKQRKPLTKKQKQLILGAAYVGVWAGIYAYGKHLDGPTPAASPMSIHLKGKAEFASRMKGLAGQKVSVMDFNEAMRMSKAKTWGGDKAGFLQPSAFSRPAFELPVGHIFHRLSTQPETDFRIPPATYATHSMDDFRRYMVGFSQELGGSGLHHVTFQAQEAIKVPALHEVLGTLGQVMGSTDQKSIMDTYRALSGGGWSNSQSTSLLDALKAKGYGAIVDEMDAGVIGDTPLVVFSDHTTTKKSYPIGKADLDDTTENLKELEHRKF